MLSATSNNIMLEPIDKKVSTLFIPPKYAYRSKEFLSGKVVSIGRHVTQVEIGEELAYAKDFGKEVPVDGKTFVFIKPKHIIAVM